MEITELPLARQVKDLVGDPCIDFADEGTYHEVVIKAQTRAGCGRLMDEAATTLGIHAERFELWDAVWGGKCARYKLEPEPKTSH
jgi:hypothetical protein